MRPVLLDLFCCEGGAATGYHRAGFDVIGVDKVPFRRYPFPMIQADALVVLSDKRFCRRFDVIHASPPCQAYSHTRHAYKADRPELVDPVREALEDIGRPYVIENVPEAPLVAPTLVCGAALECTADDIDGRPLVLRRHRLFESNRLLLGTPCACAIFRRRGVKIAGVYGGGAATREHAENVRHGGYTPPGPVRAVLMGMPWATQHGLSQAIPPAYTEYLGAQLIVSFGASPPDAQPAPRGTPHTAAPPSADGVEPPRTSHTAPTPDAPSGRPTSLALLLGEHPDEDRTLRHPDDLRVGDGEGLTVGARQVQSVVVNGVEHGNEALEGEASGDDGDGASRDQVAGHVQHSTTNHVRCQPQTSEAT